MHRTYPITPAPYPRMTRRDQWLRPPRPGVARFFAFRDEVRARRVVLPTYGAHVTFVLPMPRSWSKAKCRTLNGTPHRQTPDLDNFVKALMDSVYEGCDQTVWDFRATKRWGVTGSITITCEEVP